MIKKLPLLIIVLSLCCNAFAQVPVISSFTPSSGPAGTAVTISGKNFNTVAANNTVYFGAVKAKVTSATGTSLVVTVPSGATYKPLSVTSNGLTALSHVSFTPTYAGGASMFAIGESFAPQTELPIGTPGNAVAAAVSIADFNGDGKPDLAVLEGSGGQIYIFKNTGSSTAPFSSTYTLKITSRYESGLMLIADIDGDGKPDIVTASFQTGGINIFKNTSTATSISFAPAIAIAPDIAPQALVTADFNGDGKLDIATADGGTGVFSVLLNTTTGGNISFAAKKDFTTGQYPYDIAAGDLDGDGKPDIAIVNHTNYTVSVLRNTYTADSLSFAPQIDYPMGTSPITVRLADIDGDGKLDIVTTNHLDFGVVKTGDVLRNTSTSGNLSFAPKVDFFLGGEFSAAVDIADMDGDGKPDIVVADRTSNIGTLIQNLSTPGTINLVASKSFGTLTVPTALAIGDFTGDGKPDVAVTNGGYPNTTSVFLNDVDPLKPFIASFSPAIAGKGITVNITGTNFTGATAVAFGNTPAASFKVNSATSISAVVDSGHTGTVSVTTPHGTGSKYGFAFVYPPGISAVTLSTSGGVTTVVITGIYFSGTTQVLFNGVAASSYTLSGDNKITATTTLAKFSTITIAAFGGTTVYDYPPKPVILRFSPTSGPKGTLVIISGLNFTGATAVSFGNTPAQFAVAASNSINSIVGNGSSGDVTVTTPGGTATLAGFTFVTPPVITSFSPLHAKTGATVTITGTNFNGVTGVSFGGTVAASFTLVSPNTVTAKVGAGSSGSVRIAAPAGIAALAGFTYDAPPVIKSFSPVTAPLGATVTITGTSLSGATGVSFGGIAATSFTVVSPTTITAKVGSGKSGAVFVATPNGLASLAGFTFGALPAITSFLPVHAKAGAMVTIKGTNLNGATSVAFGGTTATSFTVVSATTITAKVGAGSSGSVSVVTPGGLTTRAGFTFDALPVIKSFSPLTAKTGDTVTITGTYFNGATAVSFGGIAAASFTVVSSTTITAKVGAGKSGAVFVVTPGGLASLAGFIFKAAPVITSSLPSDAQTTGTTLGPVSSSLKILPFPNPFQNIINIDIGDKVINNLSVELHSLSNGKLVYSKKYINSFGVLQVDLSDLANDIYALKVSMDNSVQTFKVIKK